MCRLVRWTNERILTPCKKSENRGAGGGGWAEKKTTSTQGVMSLPCGRLSEGKLRPWIHARITENNNYGGCALLLCVAVLRLGHIAICRQEPVPNNRSTDVTAVQQQKCFHNWTIQVTHT